MVPHEPNYEDARTWHVERYELAAQARRRDRIEIWIGRALTLVLGIALLGLIPLKRTEPIFVERDRDTGEVRPVYALRDLALSQDEALAEFNLTRYLGARERYDPEDLQRNSDLVYVYSSSEVWEPYAELHTRDAPGNLLDRYGRHTRVEVAIKNLSFLEKDRALVRFSTTTRGESTPEKVEHWVATVSWRYLAPRSQLRERTLNPLGFQVTHYRRDQEVVHADARN
jgi:type IV secretion system protein VirB8